VRGTAATAPSLPLTARGQERPVVLGVRRLSHTFPEPCIEKLMTGTGTAGERRAAVLAASSIAGGALSPPPPPPPPPSPPRTTVNVGLGAAPHPAGVQRASAGLATGESRGSTAAAAGGRTGSVPSLAVGVMQAPIFQALGSASRAHTALPTGGPVAIDATTRPAAGAHPDPNGADVQFRTSAAAQAAVDPLAAALGPGARGERRAVILERAVWHATRSVRIDVAAMAAAVTGMKDTLVSLKTKLDSDIQLSQHTLGRLVTVEKTLLDGIKSAVALGELGSAGAEDDLPTKDEQLLKLVTIRCMRGAAWGCAQSWGTLPGEAVDPPRMGGGCASKVLWHLEHDLTTSICIFLASPFGTRVLTLVEGVPCLPRPRLLDRR